MKLSLRNLIKLFHFAEKKLKKYLVGKFFDVLSTKKVNVNIYIFFND